MEKTIYNTYVLVESNAMRDRLKKVCVDNKLCKDIYDSDFDFGEKYKYFLCSIDAFFIASSSYSNIRVTESEWLELLKNTKL